MGAVTFSLDPILVELLTQAQPFDLLVETGTFHGDSVAVSHGLVGRVISVEADARLAATARDRFADLPDVQIVLDDSPAALQRLRTELEGQSVIYWLDAHWCGTAVDEAPLEVPPECPLLRELDALHPISDTSVVLIDDARLFLSPPPPPHDHLSWPSFADVLDALGQLSGEHRVAVINDVIIFFPRALEPAVREYGRSWGVDWLDLANKALGRGAPAAAKPVAPRTPVVPSSWPAQVRSTLPASLHAVRAYPLTLRQYPPRPPDLRRLELAGPDADIERAGRGLPTMSIVMPSFNQGDYLETSLRSVLDQRYPALEFVVRDGGSTDSSVEIIHRYSGQLTSAVIERDGGQGDAINRGFAQTTGDVMAWLNSDDLLLPHALRRVGRFFARHPEVDVVYGWRLVIDEAGLEVGRWQVPPDTHRYLDWADYIPQETLFWRRSLWERAGGRLDDSLAFAIDWELLNRFVDAGATFACLPEYLGAFRIHEASKTVGALAGAGAFEIGQIRKARHGRAVGNAEVERALRPLRRAAWRARGRQVPRR